MATLNTLFQQFLRERTYLKNVSPKTRVWYESAWKAFLVTQPSELADVEVHTATLTRAHLTAFVVASRDRGLRTVTVNTWLRALTRWTERARHVNCARRRLQSSIPVASAGQALRPSRA
jgi:hypothetical protein